MDVSGRSNGVQKPTHPQKRNRLSVSCNHCRIRKLKCSRTRPCDSCLRTGDSDTCLYAPQPTRQKNDDSLDQNTKQELIARIQKLENLLLSAMLPDKNRESSSARIVQNDYLGDVVGCAVNISPSPETHPHDQNMEDTQNIDNVARAFGSMKVDQRENQTIYWGGDHWISIMSEVDELKNYLVDTDEFERSALENRAILKGVQTPSSLLRGITAPPTQEDILSYMPARTITDVLVNRFFEAYGATLAFIHEPTFMKEYTNHWNSPNKTKVIWLGLLFAILHAAEVSYEEAGEVFFWNEHDFSRLSTDFKSLTVQCLIASDYTNPVVYTVETLMLYIHFDGITTPDRSIETPLMLGIASRLAMRMGIHRNSKAHPELTPFQDEMRRRLWATILISDTLHSFQLSLPATINQLDCNCEMPRNLRSDEFGPDTVKLPPFRPLSEYTEVTYIILKTRLILVLREIVKLTNYNDHPNEDDIRKLENALSEAKAIIPPFLQVPPTKESGPASATIQIQRISFDRVYQLGRCMLYRKFLYRARTETSAMKYHFPCIEAALNILQHQATLFLNFKSMFSPSVRRRHKFTHPTLDFFTAGMIIALDLYYGFEAESQVLSHPEASGEGVFSRTGMIAALKESNQIWALSKDDSVEAAKAYGIFSFILQKVGNSQPANEESVGESVTGPAALATEIEPPNNSFGMQESVLEFDWDTWNAYTENDVDFEAFLRWSPTTDQA
ncbi:fungal-specific transcription factor domain-containing protein [Tricladium varicosporioides]|nr:fungal-specific transcription factor domain-containing protein [Hymenoscyphus varicosporioides]